MACPALQRWSSPGRRFLSFLARNSQTRFRAAAALPPYRNFVSRLPVGPGGSRRLFSADAKFGALAESDSDVGRPPRTDPPFGLDKHSAAAPPPSASNVMARRVAEEIRYLADELAKLKQKTSMRNGAAFALAVAVAAALTIAAARWDRVKRIVGDKGAEVLSEGMQNEELKGSAEQLGKNLVSQILDDEKLREQFLLFVKEALNGLGGDISAAMVKILKSAEVLDQAAETGAQIFEMLCSRLDVKAMVGNLIFSAMDTAEMKENAVEWFAQVFASEAVAKSFEEAISSKTVNSEAFQAQASACIAAAAREVLRDPDLQRQASRTLWSVFKHVVLPWPKPAPVVNNAAPPGTEAAEAPPPAPDGPPPQPIPSE